MPADPIEHRYRTRRQRALERRSGRRARAAVLLTVLIAAGIALWRLPGRLPPIAREKSLATAVRNPELMPVVRRDTIRTGERVVAVLRRIGLDPADATAVLQAAETRASARREIPVAVFAESAAAPVREVELQIADDRSIRVMRADDGTWRASERRELWRTDTVSIRGAITGSLVESMRAAGRGVIGPRARPEVAYALAEAFEYKLDVGSDLQPGDSLIAVVQRSRTAFGTERIGPLVAGGLWHDRRWMHAIRFTTLKGSAEYYDADARPLRTTFLAAPLDYRRMSSAFGMRSHPVLGILRRHAGIDYSASLGTPVRAVGDGAVIRSGFAGGFGRVVELRHRDGMMTRYGHLRAFAQGIREGQVVTQGQIIGFVGSSGLSTGPHLHFETLVNGVSREPTRTLREASGVTLAGPSLSAFGIARDAVASRLGLAAPVTPRPTRVKIDTVTQPTVRNAGSSPGATK